MTTKLSAELFYLSSILDKSVSNWLLIDRSCTTINLNKLFSNVYYCKRIAKFKPYLNDMAHGYTITDDSIIFSKSHDLFYENIYNNLKTELVRNILPIDYNMNDETFVSFYKRYITNEAYSATELARIKAIIEVIFSIDIATSSADMLNELILLRAFMNYVSPHFERRAWQKLLTGMMNEHVKVGDDVTDFFEDKKRIVSFFNFLKRSNFPCILNVIDDKLIVSNCYEDNSLLIVLYILPLLNLDFSRETVKRTLLLSVYMKLQKTKPNQSPTEVYDCTTKQLCNYVW